MRAPLLCESIACLVLMCLLLLACFAACLTFCGMGESLGLHSLHLISSLGWVLLGCGPLLLSIQQRLVLIYEKIKYILLDPKTGACILQ